MIFSLKDTSFKKFEKFASLTNKVKGIPRKIPTFYHAKTQKKD